jgi:hypothetical protein
VFSEFDEYLSLEFLTDYWYDEGMGIASDMLAGFDFHAWLELKEACVCRPISWQVRCAEVMDSSTDSMSVEVCVKLLCSLEEDVIVAAADSLRSMSAPHVPEVALERVKALLPKASPPVKLVLGDFLARCQRR